MDAWRVKVERIGNLNYPDAARRERLSGSLLLDVSVNANGSIHLGHMVERCLMTDGLGYEVFNVSNDDTSVGIPSAEVYERFYAGVERRRDMTGFETFYANDKAKRLVGFAPRHSWRESPDATG